MLLTVIKRDGKKENFDSKKIVIAILKASNDINYDLSDSDIGKVLNNFYEKIRGYSEIEIEKLQDFIETSLYKSGFRKVKDSYDSYRKQRTDIREKKSNLMNVVDKIGIETDRDNGNE